MASRDTPIRPGTISVSDRSESRNGTVTNDNQRLPDRVRSGSLLSPLQSVQSARHSTRLPSLLSPISSTQGTEESIEIQTSSHDGNGPNRLNNLSLLGSGGYSPRPPFARQTPSRFRRDSGSLTRGSGSQGPSLPTIYTPDWTAFQSGSGFPLSPTFNNSIGSPYFSSDSNQPISPTGSAGAHLLSPSFSEITNESRNPSRAQSHTSAILSNNSQGFATASTASPTPVAIVKPEVNSEVNDPVVTNKDNRLGPGPSTGITRPRKRAVLVGVTYSSHEKIQTVSEHALSVQRLFRFLINNLDYDSRDIWILCDRLIENSHSAKVTQPDAANIANALRWVVSDSQAGDFVFFSFNGEVMRDIATDGNMVQEAVYALLASDHPNGPLIWGSDVEHMVLSVSRGANVTILLDTQWSWDIVRLPFICLPFKYDKYSAFEIVGALTPDSWHMPEISTMLAKALQGLTSAGRDREQYEREQQEEYMIERMNKFECSARVLCFAASPVKYKRFRRKFIGINPLEKGEYAMTFVRVMESMMSLNQPLCLRSILLKLGEILSPNGVMKQTPQVCGTNRLNLNQVVHL